MVEAYYESLPLNCPDLGASPVDGVPFYRFVKSNPATNEDFLSHRKKFPQKKFQVSECKASSVSIFKISTLLDIHKLPTFKNSIKAIVTLVLSDGSVLANGDNEHHSWWRSASFKIGENITYENNAIG